jgi:molecular chaperone HscB
MTEECPKCWVRLDTPLFCESCNEVLSPEHLSSPFHAMGVEQGWRVDREWLRKRLLKLARGMHPDFHGQDEVSRERAENGTARLNEAYEVLSDDFRRADWLVRSLGGPEETDERQAPPELLMEVMEWNEAVEDARQAGAGSQAFDALDVLERDLRAERDTVLERVGERLDPLPGPADPVLIEVRRLLNAARYMNKTLRDIGELRLEASTT